MQKELRIVVVSRDNTFSTTVVPLLKTLNSKPSIAIEKELSQLNDDCGNSADLVLVDYKSLPKSVVQSAKPKTFAGNWLALNVDEVNEQTAMLLIEQGYAGVVCRHCCFEQLLKASKALLKGELWFPRSALAKSVKQYQSGGVGPEQRAEMVASEFDLTPKEQSVCALMLAGFSNQQIAERNHVSVNTVKTHVTNLLGKIGIKSRKDLMSMIVLEQKHVIQESAANDWTCFDDVDAASS